MTWRQIWTYIKKIRKVFKNQHYQAANFQEKLTCNKEENIINSWKMYQSIVIYTDTKIKEQKIGWKGYFAEKLVD